ncbi:MAG: sensor histidine kinase [Chloroflexi bacterium]|nr:sensor histidine kinase [Chloroflexota bacterium]
MRELALHLLDIAENSVAANAGTIEIEVDEDLKADRLKLAVTDNGQGMDAALVASVVDPFVTSRTTRKVGLGIPLLKEAAEMCNGYLTIDSTVGKGTRLECEFQHSHIDRMPLGDVAGTLLTLVIANPHIQWRLNYWVNGAVFEFDSLPIVQELGDVSLTEPSILTFVREMLQEGIAEVRQRESVLS